MQRNISFFLVLLATSVLCFGQKKQEQEFRIEEEDLPEGIIPMVSDYLKNVKRLRFYKELDGEKSSYEIKFKRDRLLYSIEFDEKGELEDVEFIIKQTDIPEKTLENLSKYLKSNHGKYRIKKIQQQYLNIVDAEQTLKKAFQNLILPEIRYELIIATKDDDGYGEYEITFTAEGKHLLTRKSVNTKYDHVLFQ
jgi:hypothetical protein